MSGGPTRILALFGTRPEAIKMAPIVRLLRGAPWAATLVAVTGQHREMLDQVLDVFEIAPDVDLDLMRPGQHLTDLASHTLADLGALIREWRPDLILVQGDTTSASVGALAAFYERVAVGHVEAGLRSFDRFDPFPEEVNRRLITVVSDLHFAPTERSREQLLREGIPGDAVFLTGNTVVDALQWVVGTERFAALAPPVPEVTGSRYILVTLHRRESWGASMALMARALRRVLDDHRDTHLVFPMHRNPIVRHEVMGELGGHSRAHLVEPLDYLSFVRVMTEAHCIVTDSGGVQEEAPVLGKPALVLRATTERLEAIEAGSARLVGTDEAKVFESVSQLLDDETLYSRMARAGSPFGDGTAAERIASIIRAWAGQADHAHSRSMENAGR